MENSGAHTETQRHRGTEAQRVRIGSGAGIGKPPALIRA
jgi:hypothetical protein